MPKLRPWVTDHADDFLVGHPGADPSVEAICGRMIWLAGPVSGLVEKGGSHFSWVPQPSSLAR